MSQSKYTTEARRRQVERLIIENRNYLNDPTTNEPYDTKGIADDVVALISTQQAALLDEVERRVIGKPLSEALTALEAIKKELV